MNESILIPFLAFLSIMVAAAAAKSLQSCLTLCDPTDGSPPGSAVPGILQNTGAGCHLPLQCMKVKSEKWKWSRSVASDSLRPHGLQPTRLLRPWDFPGKSSGVGCRCLLRIMHLLKTKLFMLMESMDNLKEFTTKAVKYIFVLTKEY